MLNRGISCSKIVLNRGIVLFSTIFKSCKIGDCADWNRANQGPPVFLMISFPRCFILQICGTQFLSVSTYHSMGEYFVSFELDNKKPNCLVSKVTYFLSQLVVECTFIFRVPNFSKRILIFNSILFFRTSVIPRGH